jgi:hypothetical protein
MRSLRKNSTTAGRFPQSRCAAAGAAKSDAD